MQRSVNLRTVVSDVRQEIDQFSVAVWEIADGNQDLSSRTESQASSLEETVASMEQINGTVQQRAQAVKRGSQPAPETGTITQRSNEAVVSVADAMTDTSQSSTRVTEITHLIEGVAFQTHVPALNAAVEAATASSLSQLVQGVSNSMRLFRLKSGESALAQTDAVALRNDDKPASDSANSAIKKPLRRA